MRQWATHPYKQVREEVGTLLSLCLLAASPGPRAHPALAAELTAECDDFMAHLVRECRVPPELGAEQPLEPDDEAERTKARAAREW